MRISILVGALLVVGLVLLPSGAHAHKGKGKGEAWEKASRWCWLDLRRIERTPVVDDVVEYRAELRVGPGEYDRVGIHRVVREEAPWRPIEAPQAILLIHGSASTFQTAFAPGLVRGSSFEPERGLAPYLASGDVDVWGVDLRWASVPLEESDLGFMADWNIAMHVEDVGRVSRLAQVVRWLEGNDWDGLFVGGHSMGATITYAYANHDARLPWWQRDVRGIVPIEVAYKITSEDSQDLREDAFERYQTYQAMYDNGETAMTLGAQLKSVVALGLSSPDEPSVLWEGWTNLQVATSVFSMSHAYYDPVPPYVPHYHYLAGSFDVQTGVPTGFQYIDPYSPLEAAAQFPPYQSLMEAIELDALLSDAVDVPHDDYLGAITAPVLYVGAAGGFGELGEETLDLLGSEDQSTLVVQLFPEDQPELDYGHVDVLLADNAPDLVWAPIRDWVLAQR